MVIKTNGTNEDLLKLLYMARNLCFNLKCSNADNPNWYHFDKAWESLGMAVKEIKLTISEGGKK